MERTGPGCQGVYKPCRRGGDVCAPLRSCRALKPEHCPVYLLSANCNPSGPAQSTSAGNHRHHVGELSVHPLGHTGAWVRRDVGFGNCSDPGSVFLSRSSQPYPSNVQHICQCIGYCWSLCRLPLGDICSQGEESSFAAGLSRDHLFCGQHWFHSGGDCAHRT